MRALFLADGDERDPATRQRILALLPALAAHGVDARVWTPAHRRGMRARVRLLRAASRADVVVLGRIAPPPPVLCAIARAAPIVYDFDDALYADPAGRRRWSRVVRAATAVVAGSEELARRAREESAAVSVVPTAVDPALYPRARGDGSGPARLGWLGTAGNLPFLETIRPALRELSGRGCAFELRVISSAEPDWPELPVRAVPWTLATAPAELAELDIGLAPLPDTPWTRGKCGLKALEYMAAGLPVVASPVGALSAIVEPETTGLHAASASEWAGALMALLADPARRRRLGAAGRQRVEERYGTERAAAALAVVLRRAAERERSSSA